MPSLREMKLPVPESGRFGMLLNAKVNVERLQGWLHQMNDAGNGGTILLRPHPGFDTERLAGIECAELADWRQPLPEYLDSLDLAFALNTHAVVDALLHGVPVVYVGGLDPYAFDLHGFVADGIAFAFDPTSSFVADANAFYGSQAFRRQWNVDEFEIDGELEKRTLSTLSRGKG
mgnify:CR=1 FL=1